MAYITIVDNIKLARYLRIVHFKFIMLKKLYDRCVELARHKFSKPILGFVAFIESFFFPVPPDLMIVPMVVAKKEDYLKIFLIATMGSVLGGLFGYMLGVFFLDASMFIIEFYGYEEKVFAMQDKMSTRGGFLTWLGIMFLAGFTPLPFKVFTITSGVIGFNIIVFFFICLFTRGLRFFLVSYFTNIFGKKFGDFIEKKGALWFTIAGVFVVILAAVLYIIFK
jgi:membrane protein YqaA with SNARE-associated domain